ncbi:MULTISPECIES: TraX family protein [unclassified Paenibacillus]|uniref:TraX family protein n=1 Tax=unclassified Paenibacillus TaxID=185978 RepID=UPI0036D30CC4
MRTRVSSIQLLAMFTMLMDHIGAVWFQDNPAWRIIGRLALPFYIFALVTGYTRTRNMQRYLIRIALLAAVSQLPFQMALQSQQINIIATLFVSLAVLLLLDRLKGNRPAQLALTAAAAVFLEVLPFDYGAYALLLALVYRYAAPKWTVLLHTALNVAVLFYKGWFLQMFSLFSTLWLVYFPDFIKGLDAIRIPRWIWRSFYPLHLAVLALLHRFI